MYKQLIEYILHTFLKHKAVNCAKYQNKMLTNAQNSNAYMQVSIDTSPYFDTLISVPNIPFVMELNIEIMGFPKKDGTYSVLDAQSDAFQVAIEFIHYVRQDDTFMGQLAIRDYQLIGFDSYTDDNCAGQRLTIQFVLSDPVNLCTFMDNFNEEFVPVPVEDKEINIIDTRDPSEINELVLRPVLLPTKK